MLDLVVSCPKGALVNVRVGSIPEEGSQQSAIVYKEDNLKMHQQIFDRDTV